MRDMNEIGIGKAEIDTPALLIDLDLMEKNLSTMANFFRGKKAKLRAHTKVHRLPALAHKQLKAGAKGICCQKVAEAEVMAAAGIEDIIITNQIVTPSKIDRLAALSKHAKISVPVDSLHNAERLSKVSQREGLELDVLVDVHMGSNRCGVEPGEPALRLAKSIESLKGLRLMGLMGFEGHISWIDPREKRRAETERIEGQLIETKKLIEKSGISIREISTGSTGTYDVSGDTPEITEVQAGTYILMDGEYRKHVPEFHCASTVLSTVISKPSEERIITDAGHMSISVACGNPEVVGLEGLEIFELHAENTVLKIKKPTGIAIGDKIELVPSYLDGTVNYHSKFYGMRRGKVEIVWNHQGRGTSN